MAEKISNIDRRAFMGALGLGAAAVVAAPLRARAEEAPAAEGDAPAEEAPAAEAPAPETPATPQNLQPLGWLGEAPAVTDADCASVEQADVVVVGAGVAGIAAARAAVEAGASVIVVEQAPAITVRGLVLTVSHQEQIGPLYPRMLETLVYGACEELFRTE